jgi:hypothetical protein
LVTEEEERLEKMQDEEMVFYGLSKIDLELSMRIRKIEDRSEN